MLYATRQFLGVDLTVIKGIPLHTVLGIYITKKICSKRLYTEKFESYSHSDFQIKGIKL